MLRSRSDVEMVTLLFPGRTDDEVAAAVEQLGGVGRVGPDERGTTGLLTCGSVPGEDPREWCLMRVDAEGSGLTLRVEELATTLGLAPSEVITPREDDLVPDGDRTVLVLPAAQRHYAPVGAAVAGTAIEVREVDGWHLVSWADGAAPRAYSQLVGQLVVRTTEGRGRRGVLFSASPFHDVVEEFHRGDLVGGRHWPRHLWRPVFSPSVRDVEPAWDLVSAIVGDLLPQHADDDFASWGDDPVRRRAAFRRSALDIEEVAGALGLPAETGAVLRGESRVPAQRHEAQRVVEAMEGAAGLERGTWKDRVSLLSSVVSLVVAVLVVAVGGDAVPTLLWWFWVVAGALSVLHLATRAWFALLDRRRRRSVDDAPLTGPDAAREPAEPMA
ncbi:hypothetical protein RDV89_20150 [Nocardioides zeae]|uniref:Uncharacterized protein n=1 Tax=Nocardioides imazamoxiresistens TaxID=3231893 RepID=A0ABU3Q1L6_9ACTN|nr:hypothetical protein [Nocardioides zeae]MDT9595406.1 hypothetical protein [Nocardioides zeae]